MAHVTLILGGARSGKSALASRLAEQSGKRIVFIATATTLDDEMAERVQRHQQERPAHWRTVEASRALSSAITSHASSAQLLLIDCLTLWLCNLLHDETGQAVTDSETAVAGARQQLLDALSSAPGEIILVANEVGLGIVPMGALSRRFIDEAGRLNQAIAAQADRVLFVVAGLPMALKGERPC